jgi:hypothetical protein
MGSFGVGFLVGVVTAAVALGVFTLLRSKRRGEVPEKPERTLTEEEKERIREEIHSDTDRELVERILRKLSRSK